MKVSSYYLDTQCNFKTQLKKEKKAPTTIRNFYTVFGFHFLYLTNIDYTNSQTPMQKEECYSIAQQN